MAFNSSSNHPFTNDEKDQIITINTNSSSNWRFHIPRRSSNRILVHRVLDQLPPPPRQLILVHPITHYDPNDSTHHHLCDHQPMGSCHPFIPPTSHFLTLNSTPDYRVFGPSNRQYLNDQPFVNHHHPSMDGTHPYHHTTQNPSKDGNYHQQYINIPDHVKGYFDNLETKVNVVRGIIDPPQPVFTVCSPGNGMQNQNPSHGSSPVPNGAEFSRVTRRMKANPRGGDAPAPAEGYGDNGHDGGSDGRTHSLPDWPQGIYVCPKCFQVCLSSQIFAAHVSGHYKRESREERQRRLAAKFKRERKLRLVPTSHGLTLLPQGTTFKRTGNSNKDLGKYKIGVKEEDDGVGVGEIQRSFGKVEIKEDK